MQPALPTSLADGTGTVVTKVRFPGKEAETPKTLHYFVLRVLGEFPRILLEYTRTPYDNVMHFLKSDYKEFAPFGQLPNYMGPELGDGFILAQSSAICRHIARETGIFGETSEDKAMQDMLWETAKDISGKKECIHAEGSVDSTLDGMLRGIINIMKRGKYLTGTDPGYGEVCVFKVLHEISEIKPDFLNSYEELQGYTKTVAELPSISAYLGSAHRLPLTENEMGKGHSGLSGYKYISPLSLAVAEKYSK